MEQDAAPVRAAAAPVGQPFTITITVTPVVAGISVPTSYSGGPVNNGAIIGAITVTTNPVGVPYTGTLTMSGPNANLFRLSSPTLPSNLLIGPSDIQAGNYGITITAT